MANETMYNDPLGGTESSVGTQTRTDYYNKKALTEIAKESYFTQMADVINMPKNMGKKIKMFHYMPILDDRNLNDQGIDAAGIVGGVDGATAQVTIIATKPDNSELYFVGDDSDATYSTAVANATTKAKDKVVSTLLQMGYNTAADTYAELTTAAIADGWAFAAAVAHADSGNLYGSSKDVGTIQAKIPALTESGGRVNRVGMKRIEISGSIDKFGLTSLLLAA